jgi:hypothetical protein
MKWTILLNRFKVKINRFSKLIKIILIGNLSKYLDLVQVEANSLYNINLKNKLKKMNIENFILEQIKILGVLLYTKYL